METVWTCIEKACAKLAALSYAVGDVKAIGITNQVPPRSPLR
jgi:hypothetical protein